MDGVLFFNLTKFNVYDTKGTLQNYIYFMMNVVTLLISINIGILLYKICQIRMLFFWDRENMNTLMDAMLICMIKNLFQCSYSWGWWTTHQAGSISDLLECSSSDDSGLDHTESDSKTNCSI